MKLEDLGPALKAARLKSGITLEQMADTLCLTKANVESLEANKFEDFSARLYILGHIRSYCHEVGVDSQPYVDTFLSSNVSSEPELTSTSNQPRQINHKDPRFVWFTVFFILFLVALFAFWAWENYGKSINFSAEKSDVLPEIELTLDTGSSEVGSSSTSILALPEESLDEKSLSLSPQVIADPTVNAEAAEAAPLVDKSFEKLEVDEKSPRGEDRLVVSINNPSWIDVKDATGYRLYYDMLDITDSPLVMQGKAPFNVKLGDSSVVELHFNKVNFDFQSYIKADKSARFIVK